MYEKQTREWWLERANRVVEADDAEKVLQVFGPIAAISDREDRWDEAFFGFTRLTGEAVQAGLRDDARLFSTAARSLREALVNYRIARRANV